MNKDAIGAENGERGVMRPIERLWTIRAARALGLTYCLSKPECYLCNQIESIGLTNELVR